MICGTESRQKGKMQTMLDKETAQEISELCVEKIDWTIVGIEGGTVTIFTGKDRYYASYGTEGSDPITETSKSKEPGNARWFERDGTVSSDHPVICTVSVHDGKAETDVRHMPPMFDEEAYEAVANMELDRKFVHDESGEDYWPDWPKDTIKAWQQFRDEIEDIPEDYKYVLFEVEPSTQKLLFALSEITGIHYLSEIPLTIKVLPEDAKQVRFSIPESEAKMWWDVRARSWDSRFIICTHQWPFRKKGQLMYTIIDRKRNVRGACTYLGGGASKDGTYTDVECAELISRLSDPKDETQVSYRNYVPLRLVEYR